MEKSIKTIFGFLFVSFLFASVTIAQERTSFNLHRKVELKNDSKPKEITIEINEKKCRFNLRIRSTIYAGEVKLEIYDPKGNKQGNFQIGCQVEADFALNELAEDKTLETVIGSTAKLVEDAMLGDWKVKIFPKNAVGNVMIEFNQDVMVKKTSN